MKQPLRMTRMKLGPKGNLEGPDGNPYEILINPSEISHGRSIHYTSGKSGEKSLESPRFTSYGGESISFSVVFDGTGAVDYGHASKRDITSQMEGMLAIIYAYQSGKQEPSVVQITWGNLLWNARLESLETQYTLFAPSGVPLRAKATLKFKGYRNPVSSEKTPPGDPKNQEREAVVEDGDSLPMMCQKMYGDDRYYAAVARANKLDGFRLQPGQKIIFPPIGAL